MLLCKKIKLNVTERDAATLEFMQAKCRALYNWWVMRLRDGEAWPGWERAKATLQERKQHDPDLKHVYRMPLHDVYLRLDAAIQAFFPRVEGRDQARVPRARPTHCVYKPRY